MRRAKSSPVANSRANGFSLVELMVVLFVMALMATAVVLAMPGDGRALRDEAERFAARTVAARDEAIAGARPVAVVVGKAGYYFEQRRDRAWQPLGPDRFALTGWKEGTAVAVSGGIGEGVAGAAPDRQRLVFDPVGLAGSEARVRIARGGQALTVSVARDGSVKLDAT